MLAPYISKRVISGFDGKIYKQDTSEVQLIQSILDKIIEKNNLGEFLPSIDIKLIHNETLILYMNMDRKLFLTIKALKITD